jgi:hypothetical protein
MIAIELIKRRKCNLNCGGKYNRKLELLSWLA